MNNELTDALNHALENRVDAAEIESLPNNPMDTMAHLWALQSRWDRGNAPLFHEQARLAFEAWLTDTTNRETWHD